MRYSILVVSAIVLLMGSCCMNIEVAQTQTGPSERDKTIKVAVITGGHGFEQESFLKLFIGYKDIEYVHIPQLDHREIFEEISEWPYDVIVLYNMTQKISPKRQVNFVKLLGKGVGVVALHHSLGAFQNWPEFRKIIGGKYYLKDMVENGVTRKKSGYKHDVNFTVRVKDKEHPITRGMSDFAVNDETYKNFVFEPNNYVLLSTDEPSNDERICWVRGYGRAKVCYIQLGHGMSIYTDENYRRLVAQAIRWCAGQL